MSMQIVTANRLTDGIVVYFTSQDTWEHRVSSAHVSHDDESQQSTLTRALASVANNVVLDPYLIDVTIEGTTITPVRLGERIRANGPSFSTLKIIETEKSHSRLAHIGTLSGRKSDNDAQLALLNAI